MFLGGGTVSYLKMEAKCSLNIWAVYFLKINIKDGDNIFPEGRDSVFSEGSVFPEYTEM
jgi:hypothetical protein